jgi:hypothetical protein
MLRAPICQRLGDDGQTSLLTHPGEDLQPLGTEALEAVGAGAGLEGPAAQQVGSLGLHLLGHPQRLLVALHRARTGDDHQVRPAKAHSRHLDDRVMLTKLARHELVGVTDGDHLEHPVEGLEQGRLDDADIARDSHRGAL